MFSNNDMTPSPNEDFQIRVANALGRIEAKQDDLRRELLGPGGRITQIEEQRSWEDKKHWIRTGILLPILALLHKLFYH